MKRIKLITLTLIPLLITGCSGADDRVEIEAKVANQFGDTIGEGEYNDKFKYTDRWFFEDSKEVNYELALASAITGGASYSNASDNHGIKIANLLADTGFSNITRNYYYLNGMKLENSLGAIIGQKQLNGYTLLAVFPRGSGYGVEWAGNFNINADGVHEGFLAARDELLRFTKQYINDNQVKGALKIWTAGYSRGAAVTNLYSAFLADGSSYFGTEVSLEPTDIYSYSIGTPNNVNSSITKNTFLSVAGPREDYHDTDIPAFEYTGGEATINPSDAKYDYIHNFVAYADYVSKLAPSAWGFTRFGKTVNVAFGSEAMRNYLDPIDEDVAESFYNKNYSDKKETNKINYDTISIVDNDDLKMSADEIVNASFKALTDLIPDTETFVNNGYRTALSALLAGFAIDDGLSSAFKNADDSTLGKALGTAYIASVGKKLNMSDAEVSALTIMDFMDLLGKNIPNREEYTDQKLVKDIFDLLFNDYRNSEAAKVRTIRLSQMIDEPYGPLIPVLAEYAKPRNFTVTYFDDLLLLTSMYYVDNPTEPKILNVIDAIAEKIPDMYVSTLIMISGNTYDDEHYPTVQDKKLAALKDILTYCSTGKDENKGYAYRNVVMTIVAFAYFGSAQCLADVLFNGEIMDDEGTRRKMDTHPVEETMEALLPLILPTNEETGNPMTIDENATSRLVELFELGRTEVNGDYLDVILDNIELIKELLVALVFRMGETHNLNTELNNAATLLQNIDFIIPAHYFELYVCYFRTMIN